MLSKTLANAFNILNISPDADIGTIRTAYRRQALLTHPDKGGSADDFRAVALAFGILSHAKSTQGLVRTHRKRKRSSTSETSSRDSLRMQRQRYGTTHYSVPPVYEQAAPPIMRVSSERDARKGKALERLRCILQAFDMSHRQDAVASLGPHVQAALMGHMNARTQMSSMRKPREPQGRSFGLGKKTRLDKTPASKSGITGVHKFGNMYRASVAIANLEVHARLQPSLDTAVEHHIILTRIRDVVMAFRTRNNNAAAFNKLFLAACSNVLGKSGNTKDSVQLRAKVRVRAAHWMGRVRISSPVLPIPDALRWHRRLLAAKRTSWLAFRARVIEMGNLFQGSRRRGVLVDAEELADKAWAASEPQRELIDLHRQARLARALRSVELALDREWRWKVKDATKRRRSALLAEKRVNVARQRARKEFKRWRCVNDLTMQDILRGPL